MKKTFYTILMGSLLLSGCTNNDNTSTQEDAALYAQYRIWGEEGRDNVTCLLRFKPSASSAQTFVLQQPAAVKLDGEVLTADSSRLGGAYYEVQKPLAGFAGEHTITFTATNGKKYTETFSFQPFTIANTLPETISRSGLNLQINGLKSGDRVRVFLLDTSFADNGINELQTVTNSQLQISPQQLSRLARGPLTLKLIREEERPLKNPPKNGGHISLSYQVTRDLELR
jgi:hypothetical protein